MAAGKDSGVMDEVKNIATEGLIATALSLFAMPILGPVGAVAGLAYGAVRIQASGNKK